MAVHMCSTPGGCALSAAKCAAKVSPPFTPEDVWGSTNLSAADQKFLAREDQALARNAR